jgi:uncharacterized protein with HEPN domain
MSSRTDREFLSDILEAIRRADSYVAGVSYAEFLTDLKTQDAVIRALEIVGEATKRVSQEVRESHAVISSCPAWAFVRWRGSCPHPPTGEFGVRPAQTVSRESQ